MFYRVMSFILADSLISCASTTTIRATNTSGDVVVTSKFMSMVNIKVKVKFFIQILKL